MVCGIGAVCGQRCYVGPVCGDKRIGSVRHGVPIAAARDLATFREQMPDAFLFCAVGTSGSRAIVRAQAQASGFVEPETMVCVA